MAADPQNSPFIKHLASSDKKTRDTALSSLRTYLSNRPSIPPLDLLKLWKGLFYCLWMQDKPVQQQRLCRDLASLVDLLHEDVILPFLDTFWKTMAREWTGIDAHRMDKFLYLIRQYVNASWRVLARREWADKEKVERYVEVLEETPLSVGDVKVPNGLRYHVLDVYVDELEKVAGQATDMIPLGVLLMPIERLKVESKVKSVRGAARECLEDGRLKAWRGEEVGKDGDELGDGDGDEEDEWGGIED